MSLISLFKSENRNEETATELINQQDYYIEINRKEKKIKIKEKVRGSEVIEITKLDLVDILENDQHLIIQHYSNDILVMSLYRLHPVPSLLLSHHPFPTALHSLLYHHR